MANFFQLLFPADCIRQQLNLKPEQLLGVNLKMKRFWQFLILSWITLMVASVHADVVGGINFPRTLGGFALQSVIDNEKSNPGLGVTLLYKAPGVNASVYVYDHSQKKIPQGIDAPIIQSQFNRAKSDIQLVHPDAQILKQEERRLVAGVPMLQAAFQYAETRSGSEVPVLSHLYLTARKGNFVKVRTTYSASDRPDLGRRDQDQFIEVLGKVLAK